MIQSLSEIQNITFKGKTLGVGADRKASTQHTERNFNETNTEKGSYSYTISTTL